MTRKRSAVETATNLQAETAETATPRYRALRGLSYVAAGEERDVEPGDEIDDLPEDAVGWLLEAGAIEPA